MKLHRFDFWLKPLLVVALVFGACLAVKPEAAWAGGGILAGWNGNGFYAPFLATNGGAANLNVAVLGAVNISGGPQGQFATGTDGPAGEQGVYIADGWVNGNGSKYWKVHFSSSGYQTLTVSSQQLSSDLTFTGWDGPRDFKIQYSTNDSTWNDVPGAPALTMTGSWSGGGRLTNLALPTSLNNLPNVYLRWIMTSNASVGTDGFDVSARNEISGIYINGTEIPSAPTDIALSNTTLLTTETPGTVGTLSVTDSNAYDTWTYSLVSGSGSTNNASFSISGTQLSAVSALSAGTYSVRVNVYDGTYNFAKAFSITVVYDDAYAPMTGGNTSYGDYISNVTFAGINNTSGAGTPGYQDFTSQTGSVTQGMGYSLSASVKLSCPTGAEPDCGGVAYPDYIKVWFDWNHDRDFDDPNEGYDISTSTLTTGPHTITVNVPATATTGNTRMRIANDADSGTPAPPNHGGAAFYGEAEDYTVNVSAPLVNSIAPTSVQTISTATNGTSLTVSETPAADSRQWKYGTTAGGPYGTSISGATATSYTPNFAGNGTYYIVCASTKSGTTVTSNEVQVNVVTPTITTGTITGSPFYVSATQSASVNVPYTITGTYSAGNTFTAYLSDASGNFSSESAIGSRTATDAGTISATIPAGKASGAGYRILVKSSSPAVTGSNNGSDLTITLDTTAPTVTIEQAAGQADPTNSSPINFTVVFSEAVTGFTTGDVNFSASTTPGTLTGTVTGGPATYTVAVNGMSGKGTVIAAVAAGKAQDLAGNNNLASTSSDPSVTYVPPTDLGITKTDGVTTAVSGGSVTYTITASNAGPNADPSATVVDTLPASLTPTWTCVGAGGGTCTASGAGNINDTANLPAGGSVTYTATAIISASATGTLANTATVGSSISDTNPGNNSATDTDTLIPQADLSVTKTDGVTSAVPGGSVTYTIKASNAGPSNASGATVADTFPANLTPTWTCVGAGGGTCTASGLGNINDTVNLPAGSSVTYTVSACVSGTATGSLSNTATVTAPGGVTDPTPGNNSATDTDTLTPQADLSITKTDGVTTAVPGGSVTYTITTSNAGPSNASGATVADTFPASLTPTWTCTGAGGGTCTASGLGNINDTVNLPAGSSVTYTVSVTVSAAATGSLSNTATVTAPGGVTDPTPGNNNATDTDTLTPQADLSVTKTDGVTSAVPGGSVTYTITASNAGPSNASGATVADTFPASLTPTWTCAGAGGGTCTASGSGNINDTANLPPGSSVTYTANATVSISATGTLSNTATVTAPGGVSDPTPGNNSATDADSVVPPVDVTINQAPGQPDPTNASPVNFTVVFASAVTDFDDASDVTLTGAAGATTINITGGPSTYTVAVSGMTGDGAVTATIAAGVATGSQSEPNTASTSTDNTVTYDATAPDTSILTNPINPIKNTTGAFTFSGNDGTGVGGLTFECDLDSGGFSACTSPQNYTSLADGSHTFQVRAKDSLNNTDPSPASYTWVVDTIAPNTTLTGNPADPTTSTSATFTFSGDDGSGSGVASFECDLDGGSFTPCASPQDYAGPLADGPHTFHVRAQDNAGNVAFTPITFSWTVDATAPILSLPADITLEATSLTGASVTYSATANDLRDGSVAVTCIPPSGSTFPLGTTIVHCSATDATSNTANGSFKVTANISTNANLSALVASTGAFSPVFDPATITYTQSVANAITDLTVTPTSASVGATIQVRINGGAWSAVPSGSPTTALSLDPGTNPIDVQVTAADGITTKTYTNTVARMFAVPSTVSPAGTITDTHPTYVWNAVSGATLYDLYVYSEDNSGYVVSTTSLSASSICSADTCSYTPAVSLTGIDYFFKVRGKSITVTGPFSPYRYFSVGVIPAAPTTLSPTGMIAETQPTYVWNAVTGATYYDLYVYSYNSASYVVSATFLPASSICFAGTCSYTPTVTLTSTDYFFKVNARNFESAGPYSPYRYFTVGTAPAAPTTVSPTGTISETTPTYVWNAISGATWYDLYVYSYDSASYVVSTTSLFASSICSAGTCSYTPAVSLTGIDYFFKVRARNVISAGSFSPYQKFAVGVVPVAPTTVSPTGTSSDTTPTYVWNAVSGATYYNLYVYSYDTSSYVVSATFLPASTTCSGSTCSYTPAVGLTGIDYFFKVNARNIVTPGPYSPYQKFAVGVVPVAPATISPTGTISETQPAYIWNAVAGASQYDLYVYLSTSSSAVVSATSLPASTTCSGGTCSYTPATALVNGIYKFRVRAKNIVSSSPYSAYRYFTVSH